MYLNKENRCGIYSWRPIVCRNFFCNNGFKIEPICSPSQRTTEDVQICSFEGGLSLKAKFIFNPYLEFKALSKEQNSLILKFKDITSCSRKTVELIGLGLSLDKKNLAYMFRLFDGKTNLGAVRRKTMGFLSKENFMNLALYLIDENVLVGLFG